MKKCKQNIAFSDKKYNDINKSYYICRLNL